MDVGKSCWPQVDAVFFLYWISFPSQGIEGSLHLDGLPHDDSMSQEIQTSCLTGLAFLLFLTPNPFVGKAEKLP